MPLDTLHESQGFYYYDNIGTANAIPPFTPVSLATAAEVATANAAGVPGVVGDIVVPTPTAAGLATRRIVGVTREAAFQGQNVGVQKRGVIRVWANGAITTDSIVQAAVNTTKLGSQSPLIDSPESLLAVDVRLPITYNLVLAAATALPASGTIFYQLGYAIQPAAAQYDLILVELDPGVRR